MATTIAFANQKGGVGKTTSAQAIGSALASFGDRVLLVDLDPQGCLTFSCGLEPDALEPSLHDVILQNAVAKDALQHLGRSGTVLDLIPSNIDLAGAEVVLTGKTGREFALSRAISGLLDEYDWILIDCPPSLGILTICGLTASDEVVIPVQCETLGMRGVGQLLETIDDVRRYTNSSLRVRGFLATMYDPRPNLGRVVIEEITTKYNLPLIGEPVRKSIRFAEAPAMGSSIFEYAPSVPGAEAYIEIAKELRATGRHGGGG
ncbi:MAG: chromosome partitioning protein [Acidimicrobiia bacterium]